MDSNSSFSQVGDFLTDNRTLAYIREQSLGVFVSGLKPSTIVHVFFDKKNVDAFCRQATFNPSVSNPSVDNFYPAGVQGGTLKTDSTGNLSAIFYIPAGTFNIGDREILVADVADINSVDSAATTQASVMFHAANFPLTTQDASVVSPRPVDAPTSITTNRGTGTSVSTDTNNARFDPLCQSLYIGSDTTNGDEGLFVTGIDLYFQQKDISKGITIDIRTMENGIPTSTVLPFSKTYVPSASVNVSSNATLVTHVTFQAPVFLLAGYEYAISVIPDASSPNYLIWTATVGATDVTTNTPITQHGVDGTLFTSATGSTWTPLQDEYLKFTLYKAKFSATSGYAKFTNRDYEFFSIANTTSLFQHGEMAYQVGSNSAGTIVLSNTSTTVTGNGTSFSSLSVGQKVAVTTGTSSDVLTVASVSNNTLMTVNEIPLFSSSNAVYQKTCVGKVILHDPQNYELTLDNSTANSTVYFAANSTIIGAQSKTTAVISKVQNRIVNRFQPFLYSTTIHGTDDTFAISGIDSNYAAISEKQYSPTTTNYILDHEQVISSKTNEILSNGGAKSFVANVGFTTESNNISPTLDSQSTSILGYKNQINNVSANEITRNGMAYSKATSKMVTLAEGLDSEDINVYITAYRPQSTDIEIYAKVINASDPENFNDKAWSKLVLVSDPNLYSDSTNLKDVNEYQFSFGSSPPSVGASGVVSVSTGSSTVTGSGTTFTTDLSVGKLMKIYTDSSQTTFEISKVTAIANDTSLTIEANSNFTTSTGTYEVVMFGNVAFSNPQNNGIVRYYSNAGVAYDTYRSFALKVVLKSPYTYIVPRVLDIRAIALSI